VPNIHQRVYESASNPGALAMDTWHTCDTTHCRAGWVVQLAGEAGKALEAFHDTPLAAFLIYKASSPIKVTFPQFYVDNAAALGDMQRCAGEEEALLASPAAADV
jgi:hypothetical protein